MPIKKSSKKRNTHKKNEWNLALMYKGDNDPQIEKDLEERRKASYKFINKWKKRDDYLKNSKALKEALTDFETWLDSGSVLGNIGYYFSLRSAQEENNHKLKARLNKLNDFATKISNEANFFTINLSKVDKKTQDKFLKDKTLTRWHRFLKQTFDSSKYTLSEAEEKIMNLKSSPSHKEWVNMLSSLLSKETRLVYNTKGKLEELPFSSIVGLSSHSTKKIRDKAAKAFSDILDKHADVAEAEINAILLNKKINDEIRGFNRPDASRHFSDDVPSEMVDILVNEVSKHFKIAKDYYKLKAQILKKDKLAYHERNIAIDKKTKNYTYKESVQLVGDVFKNLDDEFYNFFQGFIDNNQIDVYPRQGKSGGAFCAYNLPTSPTYILLNHTGELKDVLTLAHEAGHGINDEFMKRAQPELYFGTPLVTAEVASTFTEDFVFAHLLDDSSPEVKLSLMMSKLNDEVSTIIRQIAAYKFEQELHNTFREKGYLSKEEIGQIFQKNMKAYMGPSVEQSKGSENYWIYWRHFRDFFYVYSYASGLLISKSLQASVRENPDFIDKIKIFLEAGTSKSPEKIFTEMGINIKSALFWQKGLKETEKLLKDTKKLAKELGKI